MGTPVVVVTSGGLPVTEAANGYGMPIEVAANGFGTPIQYVSSGGLPVRTGGGSASQTVLRRESDGTVTVVSLAKPFTPILTRQSDGTITVGA